MFPHKHLLTLGPVSPFSLDSLLLPTLRSLPPKWRLRGHTDSESVGSAVEERRPLSVTERAGTRRHGEDRETNRCPERLQIKSSFYSCSCRHLTACSIKQCWGRDCIHILIFNYAIYFFKSKKTASARYVRHLLVKSETFRRFPSGECDVGRKRAL